MREATLRTEAAEREVQRLLAEIANIRQQNKTIVAQKDTRLKLLEDENKTLAAKAKDAEKSVQSLSQQLQQQQQQQQQQHRPQLNQSDDRLKRLEDENMDLTKKLHNAETSIRSLNQQLNEKSEHIKPGSRKTPPLLLPKLTATQGTQTTLLQTKTPPPQLRPQLALMDLPRTLADVGAGLEASLQDGLGASGDKPHAAKAIDLRILLPRRLCEVVPQFSALGLADASQRVTLASPREIPARYAHHIFIVILASH